MRTKQGNKTPLVVFIFCTMVFLLAVSCGQSLASVDTFKASMAVREEYDDNIFLTQSERTFDWITRAIPSIGLTHRTEWWDLALDDTFDGWYYARLNKFYYSDSANLSSKMVVIKNFAYLDITDVYANVVLQPRRSSTDVNLNVNRSDSNTLNASPYLKFDIDPATFLKTGYTYTNIWYRSENGTNRQQHTGYASLDHKFSPVLEAAVGGEFVADRPDDNVIAISNTTFANNTAFINVRHVNIGVYNNQAAAYGTVIYSFSPTTKFDGMGGFRWVRFEENQSVVNHQSSRDKNKPIYNAGLVFGVTGPVRLEFRGFQTYIPSAEDGIYVRAMQQINFQYGFVSPSNMLRAGVYHRVDDYAQITRKDEAVGATAGFELNPGPRTKITVGGSYEHDEFMPDAGRRNLYMGTAGFEYKLTPKIAASLTYTYNRSTGTEHEDRFFDNHAAFQLKAEL